MDHIMRRKFNEATNQLLGAEKVLEAYSEGHKAVSATLSVTVGIGGDRVTLNWKPSQTMLEQICRAQSADARITLSELLS